MKRNLAFVAVGFILGWVMTRPVLWLITGLVFGGLAGYFARGNL